MKKQRSASPSQAMVSSTSSARAVSMISRRFSSSSGLGPMSGKLPSATQLLVTGSSPSSSNSGPTMGAAMPWAASARMRRGLTRSASMSLSAAAWNSS